MGLPEPRRSSFWNSALPAQYRLLGWLDPLIRRFWRGFGVGNVVELRVPGHRSGKPRTVLLGLLRDDGRWFLGHPNGDVAWTRNLEAAGTAEIAFRGLPPVGVRAHRLSQGTLRDRAILATTQHPFPANLIYRLARAHIRAQGTYFELQPIRD
jgi:hypothetical protein